MHSFFKPKRLPPSRVTQVFEPCRPGRCPLIAALLLPTSAQARDKSTEKPRAGGLQTTLVQAPLIIL